MCQYASQGHNFWSDRWIFNFFSVLEPRHLSLQTCIRNQIGIRPKLLMSASWLVALQGAPIAKGSHFCYKSLQKPSFCKKKKKKKKEKRKNLIRGSFWAVSLSNFSPKHTKTSLNTLDAHLFPSIFKVVFLHLIFLSFGSIPWIWGLGVCM